MQPAKNITRLIEIIAHLRDPQNGCAWDLEQDLSSLRHYAIEEAYEVADAIEREDYDSLKDELGDLLMQPVFMAQLAKEKGYFDIDEVIYSITKKLIRRHPHIFAGKNAKKPEEVELIWEAEKQKEIKNNKNKAINSILDEVPNNLPALKRAQKLANRAAKANFDWPDWQQTYQKCLEELEELYQAAKKNKSKQAIKEEIGDSLLALANLARQLNIDAEDALREANLKFVRRFQYVERRAKEDSIELEKAGLKILDKYWNEIRRREKNENKS